MNKLLIGLTDKTSVLNTNPSLFSPQWSPK